MLKNAYFLAKFDFDTADNEPAKNLQILQKKKLNDAKCNIVDNLGNYYYQATTFTILKEFFKAFHS